MPNPREGKTGRQKYVPSGIGVAQARQPDSENRVAYYRDPFEEAVRQTLRREMRDKSFALGTRSGNSNRRAVAISVLILVIIMVLGHRFGLRPTPKGTKASALQVSDPSPAVVMDSTEGPEQQDTKKNPLD